MPYHEWHDEWFEKYGNDLNKAINFCMTNWKRWGRIGSHGKEKYGTFRHHAWFYDSHWPIHSLIKPGYVYYQWPKWFYKIELTIISPLVRYSLLPWVIRKWQQYVYNMTIQRAVKKWPHLEAELVEDCEFEFLRPCLFGKLDGKNEKGKYWITLSPSEPTVNTLEYTGEQPPIIQQETLDAEDLLELYKEAYEAIPENWDPKNRAEAERAAQAMGIMIGLEEGRYDDWKTEFDTVLLPEGSRAKAGST